MRYSVLRFLKHGSAPFEKAAARAPEIDPGAAPAGRSEVPAGRQRLGFFAATFLATALWTVPMHSEESHSVHGATAVVPPNAGQGPGSAAKTSKPKAPRSGIAGRTPGSPLPSDVFVRINGADIPRARYLSEMDEALGDTFRETFIAHVLVEEKAKAEGVSVTAQEIEGSVNMTIDQVRAGRVEAEGSHIEDALRDQGMTLEGWKRRLRYDNRQDMLLDKLIMRDRTISDGELKVAFEERYGKNGVRTKIHHIQRNVNVAASPDYTFADFELGKPEVDKAARARAEEALSKLKSGMTWDSVWAEYTDDNRKGSGGMMADWKGKFGPEFDAAASALKRNELSSVFGGPDGYRILQCLSVTDTTEMHAQQILVATGAGGRGRSQEESRKKAEGLLARIKAGADFSALARESSDDAGSAPNGGDVGWFGPRAMTKQFQDAASVLQPGQVSDLVRTGYGFHIIKMLETRHSEERSLRQILISTQFTAVRDHKIRPALEGKARAVLEEAMRQIAAQTATFADLAKSLSEDVLTKDNGGLINSFKEGYYGGEFDDAAKTMKAGEPPRIVRDYSGNLHLLIIESSVKTELADIQEAFRDELMKRVPTRQDRTEYVRKLRAQAKVVP